MKPYQCRVCKLHYGSEGLAERCYAWCSKHASCNLEVARQSMEAAEKRRGGAQHL